MYSSYVVETYTKMPWPTVLGGGVEHLGCCRGHCAPIERETNISLRRILLRQPTNTLFGSL
jgi:hypothetical protein